MSLRLVFHVNDCMYCRSGLLGFTFFFSLYTFSFHFLSLPSLLLLQPSLYFSHLFILLSDSVFLSSDVFQECLQHFLCTPTAILLHFGSCGADQSHKCTIAKARTVMHREKMYFLLTQVTSYLQEPFVQWFKTSFLEANSKCRQFITTEVRTFQHVYAC